MTAFEEMRLPHVKKRIDHSFAAIEKPAKGYMGIDLENFDKETLIKIVAITVERNRVTPEATV